MSLSLKLGLAKRLTEDDLAALPPWLKPEEDAATLSRAWEIELRNKKKSVPRSDERKYQTDSTCVCT